MLAALIANTSDARTLQAVHCHKTAFVQTPHQHHAGISQRIGRTSNVCTKPQHCDSASIYFMANYDNDDDLNKDTNNSSTEIDPKRPDKKISAFMDAMLEIPDPRLLAGDLAFILIINFLLQIANEVGDPDFWMNGGFAQPVTMPTTLLDVVVRDSKMSIAWVLSALYQRSYSSSSVSDDKTAVKIASQIWVDYCSIRIVLELGGSFLFTHTSINLLLLGREFWYTLLVMAFFRLAYGRVRY